MVLTKKSVAYDWYDYGLFIDRNRIGYPSGGFVFARGGECEVDQRKCWTSINTRGIVMQESRWDTTERPAAVEVSFP